MIEAIEIKKDHFVVRSIDPLNGKVIQSTEAYTEGAAIRLAHTWNRLYIVEKMVAWLNQRAVALQVAGLYEHQKLASALSHQILACRSISVANLKEIIIRHEKTIKLIAPGEKSSHHPYYSKVILTILDFCHDMEVVPA